MSTSDPPKALFTDVFGTVVDWRSTVTGYLTDAAHESLNSPSKSLSSTVRTAASSVSWPAFAQAWRSSYYAFTHSYRPGDPSTPFKTIDQHHCESLVQLLRDNGLTGLWTDDEIKQTSMIWHFLTPWPDSPPGLQLLSDAGFETATLSNGNTSLLSDLASHGNLAYKHIVSAEDFQAYKPHPDVYNGAARKLGLHTNQCALVAAHLGDLEAAAGCGYQTIYIDRPREESWDSAKVEQAKKDGWVNMWISEGEGGFEEVARRFKVDGAGREKSGKQNEEIEDDAAKGTYQEDSAIMESGKATGRLSEAQAKEVEEAAQQGVYHEDASIRS